MRNITKPYKGNYLKHVLIVAGVTIPILLLFIFLFIVPFGREYKSVKREVKSIERKLKIVENNYEKKKNELQRLNIEYANLLSEFKNPKDIKRFQEENPFIQKIVPLPERWQEGKLFKKEVYQLTTRYLYTTLNNVYDFMKNSDDYGFKFVVDFPIELEAKKRKLKAVVTFDVYKLKPIKRDLVRPFTEIQK